MTTEKIDMDIPNHGYYSMMNVRLPNGEKIEVTVYGRESNMATEVQLWQNGVMMGLITQIEATVLVNAGTYLAINDQAIEWRGVV